MAVVSASIDPKDFTASARWPPVVDGAAGEEDKRGLGESTVPNAKLPVDLSVMSRALGHCTHLEIRTHLLA